MSQEALPNFTPPSVDNSTSSFNQAHHGESKESFRQSVSRAKQVRSVLSRVISSREELSTYLAQYGLQLLTSAVEYEKTRDFIGSSYILYSQHNNYLEPLVRFLERYPDYRPSIQAIATNLAGNHTTII